MRNNQVVITPIRMVGRPHNLVAKPLFAGFTGFLLVLLAAGLGAAPGRQSALPATLTAPAGIEDAVPDGTRFLVRLDDRLRTNRDRMNKKFNVHTLESLATVGGFVLRPNAEIRGHISRIEPAGLTGRARMWLTFDDIKTPDGRMPVIAMIASIPGNFSVRQGDAQEGEIAARTSKGTRDLEVAAIAAAVGAAAGATAHGGKGAAVGAAVGGLAGFALSSGFGQELDLPKGTKFELVLDRPLYIARR